MIATMLLCAMFSQKITITDSAGNPPPASMPLDGEAIYLNAKTDPVDAKVLWDVDPPSRSERFRIHCGREFSSGKGLVPHTLVVRAMISDPKGGPPVMAKITIHVGGIPPGPEPTPVPPAPAPSKFGMDVACKAGLSEVTDRAKQAVLKAAYRILAAKTFASLNEAAAAQKQAVADALGADAQKWSAWSVAIGTALGRLGNRLTVADMPTVFAEIAAGLE